MAQSVQMPFEANPLPMLMYRSSDLQIMDVNSSALSMYGYTRDKMLQMSIKELFPDRETSDIVKKLKEEQAGSKSKGDGIIESLKADGSRLYVKILTYSFQNDGQHPILMLQDRTSEVVDGPQNRLLSLVARNISNGVVITGPDKKIEWVNEAWEQMTGYTLDEAMGKKPGDLLQGRETNSDTIDDMAGRLKHETGFKKQVLNYRKDGSPFWNNIEVQPIHDNDGQLIQWVGIKEDITDRVKAQKEAEESRTLFYNALKLAPVPIMLRDEEGKISFINSAFEEASGYQLKDIPDVDQWIEKAHPEYKEKARKAMDQVFQKDKVYYYGYFPVNNKDGEQRIWEVWEASLGTIPGLDSRTAIVMAIDVTELQETKLKMKNELTKFRQLFEHAPNALVMSDPEGNILEVNDEFERFFGYDKDEVKGKNLDRLVTSNDSEYEEAKRKTEIINQNRTFWEETTRCTKNGEEMPVYIGGIPVDIQGEVQYHFNVYSDISELTSLLEQNKRLLKQEQSLRAKAEESRAVFRDMFEEAPEGLALLEGPDFVYTYSNPAYRQMMGRHELEGKSLAEAYPEAEEQGYLDLIKQIYNKGEVYSAEEKYVEVYRDDGTVDRLYRNVTYKPLKDEQDETYAILIHAVNVTDQVEFRKQLERQLEEKSMLLEEIHHRVKNNLAIISSILFLQQEDTGSEKARESLQEAQNRVQSIALVHQQLYQEAESAASIEMSEYLKSLLDWLLNSSKPAHTVLHTEVEADDIRVPLAKAIPMGMLATELITNACKHAFEGREMGNVQVVLNKEAEYLKMEIVDDGLGLPEEFNIEDGGTGMGLVQSLLSQLKAELTHNSTPGEGTRFIIRVPDGKAQE